MSRRCARRIPTSWSLLCTAHCSRTNRTSSSSNGWPSWRGGRMAEPVGNQGNHMKRLLLVSAMLALAACASTGGPLGGPVASDASAYKEEQLSANRYRVSYTAPGEATKAQIADRTLARAAQITLDKGQEWFEIASTINGDKSQTLV